MLVEMGVESHHNLFKKELDGISGCIAHIGNKDQENENFEICYANEIIEWDDTEIEIPQVDIENNEEIGNWGQNQDFYYELKNNLKDDLKSLFEHMLARSPENEILFFTRWQFGPEVGEEFQEMDFETFWSQHACQHLRWNTLYRIKKTERTSPMRQ
ncbi:hypothetical protein [Thalassobacterium sedimentorum]|uniref:hypothetical protein n=1 Tax=Thalassobacterium sedimentorum TaxID=3041258 RepID=UPI002810A75B|nr:hypothetical protein [Coraliomargarita sp. SDUM461004]